MSRLRVVGSLGLCFVVLAAPAGAQPEPDTRAESPWDFGIALGHGERSNPLVQSDDIALGVDVDIAWFGRRWFFDNGDGGYTFKDGERYTLSVVGRVNSDRVFFAKTNTDFIGIGISIAPGETDLLEVVEVPDRDYAVETGIELLTDGPWGYLQTAFFHDVGGTHDGSELYLSYGRVFRRQRWSLEPSVGASFKSAALNDYYWGVAPDEANVIFPEYHAGSGINSHARLSAAYQINRNWAFVAVFEYERLSSTIAASPIVAESEVRGRYAGFSYRF